ncbi:MAG: hypothetical protein A2054_06710 [Deltaproteobacteria bacterium GWA2_55_10]|nr:MAG: hypothetical protein A2054_06710 [Deltaproteobacteria bacterium GWA2_55_10]
MFIIQYKYSRSAIQVNCKETAKCPLTLILSPRGEEINRIVGMLVGTAHNFFLKQTGHNALANKIGGRASEALCPKNAAARKRPFKNAIIFKRLKLFYFMKSTTYLIFLLFLDFSASLGWFLLL